MTTQHLIMMKPAFLEGIIALPAKEVMQIMAKIDLLRQDPLPDGKLNRQHLTTACFTLGMITHAYTKQGTDTTAQTNWHTFVDRMQASGSNEAIFKQIAERIPKEAVKEKRNALAHGGNITKIVATKLRESIIGDRGKPDILCLLVEL